MTNLTLTALEAARDALLAEPRASYTWTVRRDEAVALITAEIDRMRKAPVRSATGWVQEGPATYGNGGSGAAPVRRATAEQIDAAFKAWPHGHREAYQRGMVLALNAALALPESAASPVAWRVKDRDGCWILCNTKDYAEFLIRDEYICGKESSAPIEPLYADPVSPPALTEEARRLVTLLEEARDALIPFSKETKRCHPGYVELQPFYYAPGALNDTFRNYNIGDYTSTFTVKDIRTAHGLLHRLNNAIDSGDYLTRPPVETEGKPLLRSREFQRHRNDYE